MHEQQPFKRTDRVSDLIRKIVSEVFSQRIHHQGFELVTITEVKVTPDMKSARVFYRLLDPQRRPEIMRAIQDKGRVIQRAVAAEMKMKYTPRLTFEYDESADYGNRIEQIFHKIHNEEE
jgi:ribosome-binding factor A